MERWAGLYYGLQLFAPPFFVRQFYTPPTDLGSGHVTVLANGMWVNVAWAQTKQMLQKYHLHFLQLSFFLPSEDSVSPIRALPADWPPERETWSSSEGETNACCRSHCLHGLHLTDAKPTVKAEPCLGAWHIKAKSIHLDVIIEYWKWSWPRDMRKNK